VKQHRANRHYSLRSFQTTPLHHHGRSRHNMTKISILSALQSALPHHVVLPCTRGSALRTQKLMDTRNIHTHTDRFSTHTHTHTSQGLQGSDSTKHRSSVLTLTPFRSGPPHMFFLLVCFCASSQKGPLITGARGQSRRNTVIMATQKGLVSGQNPANDTAHTQRMNYALSLIALLQLQVCCPLVGGQGSNTR